MLPALLRLSDLVKPRLGLWPVPLASVHDPHVACRDIDDELGELGRVAGSFRVLGHAAAMG